jgi:hypothetical protein
MGLLLKSLMKMGETVEMMLTKLLLLLLLLLLLKNGLGGGGSGGAVGVGDGAGMLAMKPSTLLMSLSSTKTYVEKRVSREY